jgi:hypothetical protein
MRHAPRRASRQTKIRGDGVEHERKRPTAEQSIGGIQKPHAHNVAALVNIRPMIAALDAHGVTCNSTLPLL